MLKSDWEVYGKKIVLTILPSLGLIGPVPHHTIVGFNVTAHSPWFNMKAFGLAPWPTSGPTPKPIGFTTWSSYSWLCARPISRKVHPLRWPLLKAIHSMVQPSPRVNPLYDTPSSTSWVILLVGSHYALGHPMGWFSLRIGSSYRVSCSMRTDHLPTSVSCSFI